MNRTDFSRSRTRPLGSSAPDTLFRRRSRLRLAVPAVLLLAGLVAIPTTLGSATDDLGAPPPETAPGDGGVEAAGDGAVSSVERGRDDGAGAVSRTAPFATFEDMTLRLPAAEVLLVGYHEASLDDALALRPQGDAVANDNATKFEVGEVDPHGPEYVILSSRGRARPATSAVDVVLEDDTEVLAPVSGTVREVRPYLLYGQHPDTRIEIVPDGRPDLAVVLIHVDAATVGVGDHVEAGASVIANGPNRFPFGSQIDRFFDPDRWPHVHIEVKRR